MNSIGEKLEAEWDAAKAELARITGHHPTSAAQAAAAVTINQGTPGGPVSLSSDLHAVAARLEAIGEEAVSGLEAVTANPETAKVFTALRDLTGLNISPGLISLVAAGLDELVQRARTAATTPSAGPQVAGQA